MVEVLLTRFRVRSLVALLAVTILGAAVLRAQALVANAGPDQVGTKFVGDTIQLDGGASVGATSYTWTFTKRPSGSTATLTNPATVAPTFVPDRGGSYTLRLLVGNGSSTASDTVVITTINRPPVANAGADRTSQLGKSVTIDGTASSDPDLNKLTYQWTIVSRPDSSVTPLGNATKSKATLLLDRAGEYVVQLVVKDGQLFSAPDQVTVTSINAAPIADAGPDRQVPVGNPVQLNGTGSSDVDGNPLTYQWTLKRPNGSTAALDQPASPTPSFVPNIAGTYTATLTVNDGTVNAKDMIVVTTGTNRNPVARTRVDDKALQAGQAIQLDAGSSTDSNGGVLSYAWTITKKPSGSTAPLNGPTTPRPTLTADRTGNYTFTLLVTDAGALTATDTHIFGTPLPQSDAGPDQLVTEGALVTLDGSRSFHFDATLTYGWALLSTPVGSAAELDDSSDPQPRFIADLPGTYVAQLVLFDGVRLSKADTVTITTNANLPPQVDLGPDRRVTVGALVAIDALATDPDLDPLTFSWALLSRPGASAATLSAVAGTPVHLTPDTAGDYIVQLTATDADGQQAVDTLVITTGNTSPAVTAPSDGTVPIGVPVPLSATVSDPDGGALTYEWKLLKVPEGSAAAISSPTSPAPSFTPDENGAYVVQVVVRDGAFLFATDAVVFRVGEGGAPPIADAGPAQTVAPGAVVTLDGTGSSDPENQPLTYSWQFTARPGGSTATLNDPAASEPTFTADLPGTYTVELIVNDGSQDSAPSLVTITANAAPTANAGIDQNGVELNVPVALSGTASTDPESQPLTYAWTFVSKPAGSAATILPATSATPSFTPDVAGIYVAELIVDDGTAASAPDTVTVSTRRLLSVSPTALSLSAGGTAQVTITAAYAIGTPLVVQLSSSNSSVASVPPTATIPANQLTAAFTVTGGNTSGGALVTANGGAGSASASTNVAVGARLVQWNVDASGSWETPSNWTDNAIPGAGDVVVIDRPAGNFVVTIGSGTAAIASLLSRESLNVFSTLTANGPVALEGATNLSGTIGGTGSATVNGAFTWTAGTVSLAGGLHVLTGQTLTFPNNGLGRILLSSGLTNAGTVAMGTGNALVLQTAATVTNAGGGLWTIGDTGVFTSNGAGAYTVTNAGTLRKTGAGPLTLGGAVVPYNNTGTIDLQGGTVSITDGSPLTNSGLLAVANGTTFFLHNVTLAAGTAFSGAGTLLMNGTTTVTTNLTLTLPADLSGSLTGAGTINVGAPFTWTAGTVSLAGGLHVLTGQTLTFPNNGLGRILLSSGLTNAGTVAMGTGNALVLQTAATVTNAGGGLWTIGDTGVFTSNGAGAYTVTNAGTLRKTGAGPLTLGGAVVPYSNTGTIDLQGGTVSITDGSPLTNSGLLAVANGTTFFLHNVTLAAGTAFSGAGTLLMNGTTTVTTNLTLTLPADLSGSLTGAGTINVGAPFTWTGGTVSLAGGLHVLTGQTLTFPNNGLGRLLVSSGLTNAGTVAMGTGNALVLQTAATVTNAGGGLWTIGDTGVFTSNGAGAYTVTNAGTLRKTGAGPLTLGGAVVPYSNTGTIDLQGGTVSITDGSPLTNSGLLAVANGTTFFLHNVTLAAGTAFSGAGTLLMNGTTTVTTNLTLTLPADLSGSLTGAGTINVGAPFTWTGGTVSLAGGLHVLTGQTLTFPNNGLGRLLVSSGLTNAGTVAMGTGNALVLQTAATVTNAGGGLWTIGDTGVFTSNGAGAYTVTNAGTLRKTGAGPLTLGGAVVPYSNTGTIDLQGGTVSITDGSPLTNNGPVTLAAGTTFFLNGVTLAAGSALSGAGLLYMNGTTTVTADLTVTAPVDLAGTLTGSGRLRMGASMTWTGGTLSLSGGLDVQASRTLTFPNNGLGRALFAGTSLRNFGTVAWAAGTGSLVYHGGSISVRNESGALWTYGAGGYNVTHNGDPIPAGSFHFVNDGSMTGAGSAATTLTFGSQISRSGSGTTSGMTVLP